MPAGPTPKVMSCCEDCFQIVVLVAACARARSRRLRGHQAAARIVRRRSRAPGLRLPRSTPAARRPVPAADLVPGAGRKSPAGWRRASSASVPPARFTAVAAAGDARRPARPRSAADFRPADRRDWPAAGCRRGFERNSRLAAFIAGVAFRSLSCDHFAAQRMCGSACADSHVDNAPISRGGGPAKLTTRLFSVRPESSCGSSWPGPRPARAARCRPWRC